jgi:hypothetical protein
MFEGGEGTLFDAVRAVFDPAAVTHPPWDEQLWLGLTSREDWLREAPPGAISLPDSTRESSFRAIKRRFFFEHAHGGELMGLLPRDEQEFEATLQGDENRPSLVREIILALNRFYEPECPEEERDSLRLWQSLRYDVRAPSSFVVLRHLPYQQFRIERLKLAPWVEEWLPKDQQRRRSFALVASVEGKDVALLEVDRELFLTLFEARRGLGRSSWTRTAARRVTRFIDRINSNVDKTLSVEDVRIRNVESNLEERFAVQRNPAKYQL